MSRTKDTGENIPIIRHLRGSSSQRRQYVDEEDVRVLLSRLPPELCKRLKKVVFRDHWGRGGTLGYVLTRGRSDIVLCNLPLHLSLRQLCIRDKRDPATFGAPRQGQWPPLAIRRIQLYGTLIHEIGHLQVIHPDASQPRRKFADERKAEEFAEHWLGELWSEPFDHPDPIHNPPGELETELVRSHWAEAHALYRETLKKEKSMGFSATSRERDHLIGRYREAIDRFPLHSLALFRAGRLLAYRLKNEQALDCLERALRIDPHLSDAQLWAALALSRLDRREEARERFAHAIRLDQHAPLNRAVFAEELGKWGETTEAERLYRSILRGRPDHDYALRTYGRMLYSLDGEERIPEAISLVRRALEVDPSSTLNARLLGQMLCYVEETEEAIHWLSRAIEMDPRHPAAYKTRAEAYEEMGEEAKSQADLEMVERLMQEDC